MKKTKLGDVCDLSIGFVGTVTTQYEEGGIPFFRTLNIKPYKIDDSDLKRITKKFHESQKKSQLFKDDIIMVHTGVPGICCVIDDKYNNSNCIDAIVIKPHKDEIDSHFLEAYMNTIGYKHIEKQQVGCVQKHFNLKDAVELSIFIPSIEKQKKIGKLAFDINKQIEINNQINSELESMAKTIYDYWFLQFEFPNEEGKPYKSSGGKMVWNDELKREIPEGWEVKTLNDISRQVNGYPFSTNEYLSEGLYKLYTIKNVQNTGIDTKSEAFFNELPPNMNDECLLKSEDLIMSLTGNVGRVGIVYEENALLNQRVLKLVEEKVSKEFLYCLLKNDSFRRQMERIATGTSQKNLSPVSLGKLSIVIPDDNVLNSFNLVTKGLIKKITFNNKQNQELTSLRDFLLPMLMNGQVTFKDN